MPSDILNAYFSWSRPSGSTKPVANFLSNDSSLLQTSLDSLPSFARTLENYLGSVYTDLDPKDGLDFSSSSLDHLGDINRDECIYNKLTDTGLANKEPASGESSTHYSANDLAMAHMLYKCFGSSSYNTDDVYNIDDAFGMITSKELADKITEMLSADQAGGANMINSMFNHLLSSEALRYVGNETTASALFSNNPSPQDVSGSWGFVRGDKVEFTLRLMYRAPVTTVDSDGNESAPYVVGQAHDYTYTPPSGPSNPAPNPANVINIRLQITCDAPQGSSAPTAPSAPRSVSAVPGNGQATVSWTPPADSGGSAITSYTVTSSPGGFTATGASSPLVVSGLTNGTSYTFRVVASNSIGNSPGSSSSAVSILSGGGGNQATVPRAPRSVSATVGNGQASVSFTAPISDGGSSITSYTVTSSPGGFSATGASSPLLVTGLSNGTAYTFSVVATNSIGNSSSSSSSAVTPATVPDAPTSVSGMFGDNQALVSWSAPANDGGSAITSYTVTSFPGGFTGSASSSPATVSGLSNGTAYTFTVVATNSVGDSPASSASDPVTPSSAPDAPTAVSATAGNGEATVSWTAPFDEGAAITSYTVISSPDGITASSATTSVTVTGLTNGTAYTFTVYATNMDGNSGVSLPSDPVTPFQLWTNNAVVTKFVGGTAGILAGTGTNAKVVLNSTGYSKIVMASDGNLYGSNFTQLYKCTPEGVVTFLPVRWISSSLASDGVGSDATFNTIYGMCADNSGNIYFTERNAAIIRKINIYTMVVTTLAGNWEGRASPIDGVGTNASFRYLSRANYGNVICFDKDNNCLYISDTYNQIRKLDLATNTVTTLVTTIVTTGYSFAWLTGIDYSNGNIYISDRSSYYGFGVIYKMNIASGIVTVFAGHTPRIDSEPNSMDGIGTNATFAAIYSLNIAPDGNLYVTDLYQIRKVTPDGVVTTFAGGGVIPAGNIGYNLDPLSGNSEGTGTNALFNFPTTMAFDQNGVMYVEDLNNKLIYKIV